MTGNPDGPDVVLLTPEETARRLNLHRSTVYALIRDRRLQSVKIGRARRVPVAALHNLVQDLCEDDP